MKNFDLNKIKDKDDRLLVSNILDKYYQGNSSSLFLNEYQYKFIYNILKGLNIEFKTYYVNDYCFKKVVYFGEEKDYVSCYRIIGKFLHKDVLGALFNIYKDPDMIGDIFIFDDYCYITNLTKYNKILEKELLSIGKSKIKLERIDNFTIDRALFLELEEVVPSLRVDAVISKLANLSRSSSTDFIKNKKVLVNYKENINTSLILREDDIISIRGVGKFRIGNVILHTKKDNLLIKIYKYI